jgi:hypothetical protein
MKRTILTLTILSTLACDPASEECVSLRDANTKGVYIESFNGAAIDRAAVLAVIQECGKQLDPPQRLTLEWEDGPGVGTGIRNVIHLRGTMLADFDLLQCYTQVFMDNGGIKIPE